MVPHPKRTARTYTVLFTVGLCTASAVALATWDVNAQAPATTPAATPAAAAPQPEAVLPSLETMAVSLTNILTGSQPSSTEVPLTSQLQPTTPWPVPATITQTLKTTSEDLLAYEGIDAAARKMLGADYAIWHVQFNSKAEAVALPQSGLLMATGCLQPRCNMQKSLLIADPTNQKIYAAMVTEGKVAMWPSLMSWPDAAVPTLKDWLSDATR